MNNSFPRYTEGDILEIRGNKYIIDQVDITSRDNVLQYRTERLDDEAPPITLIPNQPDNFTVKIFEAAEPEDITVIEE